MYIEFVIVDNFLLTYLAGAAATRLCHNKISVLRLSAASAVGTITAVFYPFLPSGLGVTLSVKIALFVTLCVIMYYKTPRPGVGGMMFLGCTFALGGACYAVNATFFQGTDRFCEYMRACPVFSVVCISAAVYAGIRYFIMRMRVPRARAPYEYGTEVTVFGTKMTFSAFLDTGNCVFDGKSGLPVVITDIDRFTDKLDGAAAVEFAKQLPKLRKMYAETHGGKAEIYLIEPTRITVYSDRHGHKINAMVGLIGGGRKFVGSHEMLLCSAALTEGV